jgi:hypothetical protein
MAITINCVIVVAVFLLVGYSSPHHGRHRRGLKFWQESIMLWFVFGCSLK